ncbi:MAG: lysylphosphatidylglycerol synthase transmembrane domain-containing protein [Planctomycetota bacterium]
MKRPQLSGLLRIGCGIALVGWLLWQAAGHEAFAQLRENPPDLGRLAVAWVAILVALVLAFTRWRLVAAAAGIAMTQAEALRLGAIGFACNFVALGSVGGDVVKAALLAKPRPGQRARAVATVVVDRLMGLLGFLTFAAVAILWTGTASEEVSVSLRVLSRSVLVATGVAITAFVLPLMPGRPVEKISAWFHDTPLIGGAAERIGNLASLYRDGRRLLLVAMAVGLSVNAMIILSFYAAATALRLSIPGLAEHLLIVPLAMISGALPISPNGLGTIEATAEFLYRTTDPNTPVGAGVLAALSHRLAMIAAGVTCAAYYYATSGRLEPLDLEEP